MTEMMTLDEMRARKKELGYSYEKIAELSGVPRGTVQKVLGGFTDNPRQKTIEALTRVLAYADAITEASGTASGAVFGEASGTAFKETSESAFTEVIEGGKAGETGFVIHDSDPHYDNADNPDAAGTRKGALIVRNPGISYAVQKKQYTIDDIYALPDGVRAELVDGQIYYMASPSMTHQNIVGEMFLSIAYYIRAHGGPCKVCLSPFGVYLNGDDSIYLEPDLAVVCDPSRLEERGLAGAPDWVVEVSSPSSRRMDYLIKPFKYRAAGVKEYWIIHPRKRIVFVYVYGEQEDVNVYSFEDAIPCSLYPDLKIRLADHV